MWLIDARCTIVIFTDSFRMIYWCHEALSLSTDCMSPMNVIWPWESYDIEPIAELTNDSYGIAIEHDLIAQFYPELILRNLKFSRMMPHYGDRFSIRE